MELENAIRIEGALDFIKRGFSRVQHIECFDMEYRELEGVAFDDALKLVDKVGTVRKAINQIEREIDSYR